MKIQSPIILKEVGSQEMKCLTKETRETLDIIFMEEKKKKFTQADLWKIHQQKRTFLTRKYI